MSQVEREAARRKPALVRVPADDCAVEVDGTTYHPHEGEWIELMPGIEAGDLDALYEIQLAEVKLNAASGEPDEDQQTMAILRELVSNMREFLAGRIEAWNWSDMKSRPYPPLDGTVEPLRHLRVEELAWMIAAIRGRTAGQRKNGLRPSETTIEATSSRETKGSTGGRSRAKR